MIQEGILAAIKVAIAALVWMYKLLKPEYLKGIWRGRKGLVSSQLPSFLNHHSGFGTAKVKDQLIASTVYARKKRCKKC